MSIVHPFTLAGTILAAFAHFFSDRVALELHRIGWEASSMYRETDYRKWFQKWDAAEGPAPKLRPEYARLKSRVQTFFYAAACTCFFLAWLQGRLVKPNEISFLICMLFLVLSLPHYLIRRMTIRSTNTGRRVVNSRLLFSPKLLAGGSSSAGKEWAKPMVKEAGKTFLHLFLFLVAFIFAHALITGVLGNILS